MSEHNIVTQLRESTTNEYFITDRVMLEAADEIERLTADRDRWRSIAERAMDLLEEANRVLAQIQEGLKHD